MPNIRPFRPWLPRPDLAGELTCPPYDVIDSAEARVYVSQHPESFMRVERPETQLEAGASSHDPRAYAAAGTLFEEMKKEGLYEQDDESCYYLYTQKMGAHQQRGLVCCVPGRDYFEGRIKKHELTRPDKEQDRINHLLAVRANTGPVFLTYRSRGEIEMLYDRIVKAAPYLSFEAEGVEHIVHRIADPKLVAQITAEIDAVPYSYIADGHHRSAAGALTAKKLGDANPDHTGEEEYAWFVAIMFPHDQLQVLGYHRWVCDLNGLTPEAFLEEVRKLGELDRLTSAESPEKSREVTFRLGSDWYRLRFAEKFWRDAGPVERLDVSLLQELVLAPLLGIGDPRTDERIEFVGGIRGLPELERRVALAPGSIAFALHPVSTLELMDIADVDSIMPPKSTWFEPKLRSGLFLHAID